MKLFKGVFVSSLAASKGVMSVLLVFFTTLAMSQTATTTRSANIRLQPDGNSSILTKAEKNVALKLLNTKDTADYYKVATKEGVVGFVYRSLVRIQTENPSWFVPLVPVSNEPKLLNVCSFNIKFLGSSKSKDNVRLTQLMMPYDLVIVQELVAPPYDGAYLDGVRYEGDEESAPFFDLMRNGGFSYYLSNENTGKTVNRVSSTSAEWFVVFYRPTVLRVDSSRCDFVSTPLVANPVFDRVPFRFQFATTDGTLDFSIINVHLASDEDAIAQRKEELHTLATYAQTSWTEEKDFLIVGDFNIQDNEEYANALPSQWKSLNDECVTTNVAASRNAANKKPFDHVVYHTTNTTRDLDVVFDIQVVDIFALFYPEWAQLNPTKAASSSWVSSFGSVYSDHHPVAFRLVYGVGDDD